MAQEYTSEQLQGMGLNPNETTSTQTVGGKVYKLENTGRGTRFLNEVGSSSQVATQGAINDLNSRYDKLISSLTQQGESAAQKQTAITSSELGKRGILGGSTLAQQEIQNAAESAKLPYTAQATQADIDRSNAILGAQTNLANLGETQRQFDITSALKKAELEMGGNSGFKTVGAEGGYVLDANGNIINTLPSLKSAAGGEDFTTETNPTWVNQNGQVWQDTNKFPVTTLPNGQTLFSDGSKGWTQWFQVQ